MQPEPKVYSEGLTPIDLDANGLLSKVNGQWSSPLGNRYLWQGREYSWATGLYNFRARWYDPITGRWLSKDPIGISGGLNQYRFCHNNPVNYVDPDGLRIRLAGSSRDQATLLRVMRQFIRGKLSVDKGGYVSREPCSGDQKYEQRIDAILTSENIYNIAMVDDVPDSPYSGAFAPGGFDEGGQVYIERDVHGYYSTYDGFLKWGHQNWTYATLMAHELMHAYQHATQVRGADNPKYGRNAALEKSADRWANEVYPRMGMPLRVR